MNDSPDGVAPAKSSIVSIKFLLVAGLLAGVVIAGPWVMYQVMVMQEQTKTEATPAAPETSADDSQTEAPAETATAGGGEGRGGGQRGGGGDFDPEAFFATRDEDNNGKLEGDEITERMQERVDQIDTDKDGAVSKEEFLARMRNRGGAGGRGGRGQADDEQQRPDRPAFDDDGDSSEQDSDDGETESKDSESAEKSDSDK